MQTTRLFAFQRPSRVQILLDSLVQSRELLPDYVCRITDRGELPFVLQRIVIQAQQAGRVWSGWTDGSGIWLFTAEMSMAPSRQRGQPALQVSFYREDGRIKDCRLWACTNDGSWQQCAM